MLCFSVSFYSLPTTVRWGLGHNLRSADDDFRETVTATVVQSPEVGFLEFSTIFEQYDDDVPSGRRRTNWGFREACPTNVGRFRGFLFFPIRTDVVLL